MPPPPMPPDNWPQGVVRFPGITGVKSGTYTLSHGITAGVVTIECAPQDNWPAEGGDCTFVWENQTITIPDCKVDQLSVRRTPDGYVWTVTLFDRRWKWAFGRVSGRYNWRKPDGTIEDDWKKTPQQLAALCLDAMGETGYSVSAIVNDRFPETDWAGDNPAQALAALCDLVGCRVVVGLDSKVRICRIGVGAALPTLGVKDRAPSINPPERPDKITVQCGKSRWQMDLDLEPVGEDLDGKVYPIDQLSYKPTGGWESCDTLFFGNVSDRPNTLGRVARQLAQNTVWRWYRVKMPTTIPGFSGALGTDLRQILPIENDQVDSFLDYDGKLKPMPAWVLGSYYSRDFGFTNTAAGTCYTLPFSIDNERGIVQFTEAVLRRIGDQNKPASIKLRVAVSVRDKATWAWNRYERTRTLTGDSFGTKEQILKHEEIVWQSSNGQTTETAVNIEADYYIDAAAASYQNLTPEQVEYGGLLPIDPDGAIQQVTWSVGNGFAVTKGSRNNEWNPAVPSFRERRLFEDLRGGVTQQLRNTANKLNNRKET